MRLPAVLAYLRFLRAETAASADDEALGTALLGHAQGLRDRAYLGLAAEMARLSGRRAASLAIGAFGTDRGRMGPWEVRLRPQEGDGGEPAPLATLLAGAGGRGDPLRTTGLRAAVRNRLRALRMARDLAGDGAYRSLDARSLGAAMRPVVEAVEERLGGRSALFLGVLLTSALAEAVRARAGRMTLEVTGATVNDVPLGSWSATLSLADGAPAEDPSPGLAHGVIEDAPPSPGRAMQARRFLRMARLTELGVTYRRDQDGAWKPGRIEFRGDPDVPRPPVR